MPTFHYRTKKDTNPKIQLLNPNENNVPHIPTYQHHILQLDKHPKQIPHKKYQPLCRNKLILNILQPILHSPFEHFVNTINIKINQTRNTTHMRRTQRKNMASKCGVCPSSSDINVSANECKLSLPIHLGRYKKCNKI